MKELTHNCPACGGDGKETCNNPDHGFISMLSFHDIGRIGCPCCGHDPEHKVRKWDSVNNKRYQPPCDACGGLGRVTENKCMEIMEEWNIDEDPDCFITESGITILIP